MNCPLCPTQELTNYYFGIDQEQFLRRCPNCQLQWQKLPVQEIMLAFSEPEIHRYTKLTVLNMINLLPLHQLYEFYLVGREAFTIAEFNNLLTKLEAYQHNQKIKEKNAEKRTTLASLRQKV